MKGKRLLILGAAFALGLSACAGADGTVRMTRTTPFKEAVGGSDTIDSSNVDLSGTGNTTWTTGSVATNPSGAAYSYRLMGSKSTTDGRIGGTNGNGGIWTTASGGTIKSVTVTTVAAKTLALYGGTTAFTTYSDTSGKTSFGNGKTASNGTDYSYTWSNLASQGCTNVLLKGTESSTFIKSVVFEWEAPASDPEIILSRSSITVSKGENATFVVTTANLTSNFAVSGGNSNYFTTSYTSSKDDGNHVVTLTGVEVTTSPITLTVAATGATSKTISVSVVEAVYYEKVTALSSIKAGKEFIIGTTDGTSVLAKYASGNNCTALGNVPNPSGKLIESELPEDVAIFAIGGESGSWTLTDQNSNIYYGVSGSNNLKASASATDTWSISISSDGVATITSAASSRIIKKNSTDPIFSTYTSGQSSISVYMIQSASPEIQVTINGSDSLGVGESAVLNAEKLNGASGTINWATSDPDALALSSSTGDSVTVTAGSVLGTATITASLTDCEDVTIEFTVRRGSSAAPYTVAQAIAAIDANSGLVNVYVQGIVSQVDSLNSDNTITYWISDDGTTTNQFEVYKGLNIGAEEFESVDDVEVGAEVVVKGNIKKYSSTYEFDKNNELVSYSYHEVGPEDQINALDTRAALSYNYSFEEAKTLATDTLDNANTIDESTTSYSDWTYSASSGASYAGNSAGDSGTIQLRTNNSNSGIITTASCGNVAKVAVTWNSKTSSGRKIDIYGKNTAYTAASDLYGDDAGTKLGTLQVGVSTELVISGSYSFIGIRSSSGALYLDSVTIEWGEPASFEFSRVALILGGFVSQDLWNELNGGANGTNIKGYGVIAAATEDLGAKTIKDQYDECVAADFSIDDSIAYVCDGENVRNFYTPLTESKLHPAEADETQKTEQQVDVDDTYYVWSLRKNISDYNKAFSAIAYIRLADKLVFFKEVSTTAKQAGQDLIDNGIYTGSAFDGSLGAFLG